MICFMKLGPENDYSVFNNVNVTLSGLHSSGVFLDDYHLQERWEVHYNVLHVEN